MKSNKFYKKQTWSQRVTEHSDALDLEPGVFTWHDPKRIARSLKRSAETSRRKKSPPFRSAMSMLNFYINRAGKNLNRRQKETLERAKLELRAVFRRNKKKSDGKLRYVSLNEKDTFAFAEKSAAELKGGEVIGLVGDLGAGKTVFVQGLAAGLKVKNKITSPTFVLMKVYPVKSRSVKQLVHIDAYRIKTAKDIAAIGAEEHFNRSDTVTVIEWAEKIKKILPPKTVFVKLKHGAEGKNKRIINYF